MKGEMDKVGSAKKAVGAIKEMKEVDPTKGMRVKKVSNMMDFNSDDALKPNKPAGGTRTF